MGDWQSIQIMGSLKMGSEGAKRIDFNRFSTFHFRNFKNPHAPTATVHTPEANLMNPDGQPKCLMNKL